MKDIRLRSSCIEESLLYQPAVTQSCSKTTVVIRKYILAENDCYRFPTYNLFQILNPLKCAQTILTQRDLFAMSKFYFPTHPNDRLLKDCDVDGCCGCLYIVKTHTHTRI